MSKYYDVDELVRSLIGRPLPEIFEFLSGAAGVHDRWLRMPRKQRALYEGTSEYSQFAKGALFFLIHAPGCEPNGVSSWDFVKITPLVRDIVARGIAAKAVADWLAEQ